jgi:glutathione S-transferase
MKMYETKVAPNPRRVRIFLAEKGIDMDYVEVDISGAENLSPEIRNKNPSTKVPFLELDDGTCIGETMAICRYFEETHPDTPLLGRNALEKAQVEMWQRQVEFQFMLPVVMAFQHNTGFFKDRMVPVAEWGQVCAKNAMAYFSELDQHLSNSPYLVGDYFSVADINLLCALDFARAIKLRPDEHLVNLLNWRERVASRASAKA